MTPQRKSNQPLRVSREQVIRLWFDRQGLLTPRGGGLTRAKLSDHLERTGGLQLDSVNVLDRAHYLTLWSRFGAYDKAELDRWVYKEGLAQDFLAHVACLVPPSRLPISRRRMLSFNPTGTWWERFRQDPKIEQGIMRRIRREGPLESADFKGKPGQPGGWWDWREEKVGLEYLFRKGKLAVSERRSFRRVFDLAGRVLPAGRSASQRVYDDSWLLAGLAANGVAPQRHLHNYLTVPHPQAASRREIIARNLRRKRIVEIEVDGLQGSCYALPEMLEAGADLPAPHGTNLLCPFDSLLWQRDRTEELLGFNYRIEIYVPAPKRRYGYYVLPILHEGRFVGRVDPKFDRQAGKLLIRAIQLDTPALKRDASFRAGFAETLRDLATWQGAAAIDLPRGWGTLL